MIGIGILIGLIIALIIFWLSTSIFIKDVVAYLYENDYLNERGEYYYLKDLQGRKRNE